MRNRWLVVCALIVGGAVGLWWWRHHGASDTAATPALTHATGSATMIAAPHAEVHEPAHLTIAITDTKGAIADAIVRLAPADGEVVTVHANSEGIAHAEVAAGEWSVSASAPDHEPGAAPSRKVASGERVELAIRLFTGGRTLTGLVADATSGPIAGVRIDAAKLSGGDARPDRAVATTVTGADGRYKLTVSEGQLLVAASHAEYAPQSRYVDVSASGATADFALVPGGVIEGFVRDATTRQVIAGAAVSAERQGSSVFLAEAGTRATVSGPDGHFRLAGLRPGGYELGAREHHRTSRTPTRVGLGVAEQVADVEILIAAAAVVRGNVVDEAGAPAANVTCMALGARGSTDAISGADGAFVLEGLRPGRWTLTGHSDVFVAGSDAQVELADKDVVGARVMVRHGGKLVGHVEPRQVCNVQLDLEHEPGLVATAAPVTTGPDGEFALGPVAPGKATIQGRCPSGDQGSLAVDAPNDVVLHVNPGASIAGRVVDAERKPIANVTVMAAQDGPSEHTTIVNGMVTSGVQGLTNGSGAFELRGLTAGAYRLAVLDHGHPLPGKPAKVTLAATEHKTGVEVTVDRANGTIQGIVTGPDGKPLADAWVSARQNFDQMMAGMLDRDEPSGSRMMTVVNGEDGGSAGELPPALTDPTGHFVITGLARAHYDVIAEAQGGVLRGRAADVTPDATITIQALGLSALHGTVKGATIPAVFTVELDGPTSAQRSFTGETGAFDFAHVDPGAYVVKVTSSAGNGEASVVVAAGQPASVDITLAENAIVIGKLVDAAGHPLGNEHVAIIPDTGDGHARLALEGPPPTSAADGTFRVEAKAGKSILLVLLQPSPFLHPGLALEAGKTFDTGVITVDSGPPKRP